RLPRPIQRRHVPPRRTHPDPPPNPVNQLPLAPLRRTTRPAQPRQHRRQHRLQRRPLHVSQVEPPPHRYGVHEVSGQMVFFVDDSSTGDLNPCRSPTHPQNHQPRSAPEPTFKTRPSTMRTYDWLSRCYVVPLLGTKRLARLQPPELRVFFNRVKETCQCCAQGKDAARVKSGEEARCCAKRPRKCCEAFPADGTVRHLHRMARAALQDAVIDGMLPE